MQVIVLVVLLAATTASPRERRQSSGCFWWKGECSEDEDPTRPAKRDVHEVEGDTAPSSDAVSVRDGSQEYESCNHGQGVCVPYYLCQDGTVATDGAGVIDIRFGEGNDNVLTTETRGDCGSYLDVCCKEPQSTTTPRPISAPHQLSCGRRNVQGIDVRIQGFQDNEGQFAEFPWMTAVLKKEKVGSKFISFYTCGGSLIHTSIVLTAAHCVASHQAADLKVRLGEWDTQRTYEPFPYQDRDVRTVIIHPEYNVAGKLFNDFALLYLDTPAEPASNVDTICLGYAFNASSCLVTGWGKDKFGKDGLYQNILKRIYLPLWEHERCQNALRTTRLGPYFELDQSFVCAGGEAGKDSCSGDGGSPLVCLDPETGRYIQAGMVAWGIGCGTEGIPGVYVNVPFGYDWITGEMDKLLANTPGQNPAHGDPLALDVRIGQ